MASRNLGQAGSPACRIWFSLSSGTNRASGMSRANSRPCSKGMRASSVQCSTRVGTVTFEALALTSTR